MQFKILAFGLAILLVSVRGSDLIPIEDFARSAEFSDIALSPDGEYVGYIREYNGVDRMCFSDVATLKTTALNAGVGRFFPYERGVFDFDWISPTRLVLRTSLGFLRGGWLAVDRDRKNVKPLSGDIAGGKGHLRERPSFYASEILYKFDDGRNIIVTNPRHDLRDPQHPDLVKLDTRMGEGITVITNPGNVVHWAVDLRGQVRAGITLNAGEYGAIYRESEREAWRTVANFGKNFEVSPISFTDDGSMIYVSAAKNEGTAGLYRFDPRKDELGEEIWKDPVYDLKGFVREPGTKRLIGVRYTAEARQIKWLDEKYAALQASVDKALPGQVNNVKSFSLDRKWMLISSYSDRVPETAYLYDIEKSEIRELGKTRDWIKPEQMAEMFPITYDARDGLKIHGFLTVPRGCKPDNLPLIVMPHGGPAARDEWRFDPLIQMLASRGYAVLQMNYRGSTGYGLGFEHKGRRVVGGKIQEDIEDATRWTITQKIADPKRIAIVGVSYGGCSTLLGLGKSPDLYCCGISIAGVSDWQPIYMEVDSELDQSRDYLRKLLGDPRYNEERWRAIYPVDFADKITAPLLIIQGEADWLVPPRQARKMISALEKAGHKPESLFIPDEAHGFHREKSRLLEYKAIEAFLAKHLGPGVTGGETSRVSVAKPVPKN